MDSRVQSQLCLVSQRETHQPSWNHRVKNNPRSFRDKVFIVHMVTEQSQNWGHHRSFHLYCIWGHPKESFLAQGFAWGPLVCTPLGEGPHTLWNVACPFLLARHPCSSAPRAPSPCSHCRTFLLDEAIRHRWFRPLQVPLQPGSEPQPFYMPLSGILCPFFMPLSGVEGFPRKSRILGRYLFPGSPKMCFEVLCFEIRSLWDAPSGIREKQAICSLIHGKEPEIHLWFKNISVH